MQHHILIIDDEQAIRDVICTQLADTGYDLLTAEDGEQAIRILDDNALTVDVIICDLRMPKINGTEAIAYFRREYPTKPVIVLTGYPDVNRAVDFMKEGVVDYLVKPVEKQTLIAAVERAASQRNLFGE